MGGHAAAGEGVLVATIRGARFGGKHNDGVRAKTQTFHMKGLRSGPAWVKSQADRCQCSAAFDHLHGLQLGQHAPT